MNRCPNCAAQNRDGAKFCTSCGFRLPVDSPPLVTSDRSPFATTATPSGPNITVPSPVSSEPANGDDSDNQEFATWGAESIDQPAPGKSWHADPPVDTAVPVSDEMIAALVGDTDLPTGTGEDAVWNSESMPTRTSGNVSVEALLRLARELEYGLIELAEAPDSRASAPGNVNLLRNALGDLQDDDELSPLRAAISTAQERPRDVDVMLDLVLRADAIAALMTERDQLKSAIERYLDSGHGTESEDAIDAEDESDDETETIDMSDEMVPGDDQPSI